MAQLRESNRENAVSTLPREIPQVGVLGFQPDGRATLYFLNHHGRLAGPRECGQKMNMILNAADNHRLAIQMGHNAAEVAVQFFLESGRVQPRSPILGRKNGMDQYLRKRLWHDARLQQTLLPMQPLQG